MVLFYTKKKKMKACHFNRKKKSVKKNPWCRACSHIHSSQKKKKKPSVETLIYLAPLPSLC